MTIMSTNHYLNFCACTFGDQTHWQNKSKFWFFHADSLKSGAGYQCLAGIPQVGSKLKMEGLGDIPTLSTLEKKWSRYPRVLNTVWKKGRGWNNEKLWSSLMCHRWSSYCSGKGELKIQLTLEAREKVQKARDLINQIVESKEVVYGVNTGFGKFARVVIPHDKLAQLQINLIRSHAICVGEPLSIKRLVHLNFVHFVQIVLIWGSIEKLLSYLISSLNYLFYFAALKVLTSLVILPWIGTLRVDTVRKSQKKS